jgi:Zn-dependent protease with chaperone function
VNFFERQHAARGTTVKLVVLFAAAVIALVAVFDGVVVLVVRVRGAAPTDIPGVVVVVTAVVLLIVAGGMISKTVALHQGGSAVALSVGATPIDPSTTDPNLRRLVNIVEEMSLASGVPTPRLFVLDNEPGINAFAAGFTPADAAITVTGGALRRLNRDELQGVIGHEFSHILNGDMRLNIRLIALLSGILLIGLVGLRVLQVGGRAGKNGLPILAIALAMVVLGFVGVFFANLIKAAVSRQREWLADASAVQFTRQTTGLEGALKKIAGIDAGSSLEDTRAGAEVSHMLFGEGRRSFGHLWATHPPLLKRIQALDPAFRPEELKELQHKWSEHPPIGLAEDRVAGFAETPRPQQPQVGGPPAGTAISVTPAEITARVGTVTHEDLQRGASISARIPEVVRRLASQRTTAPAVALALLVSDRPDIRNTQMLQVQRRLGPQGSAEVAGMFAQIGAVPPYLRLPVVAIAAPQLAARPRPEQEMLLATLNDLALADGTVSMFEYSVTRLVWSYLRDAADPRGRSKVGAARLGQVLPQVTTLLGELAVAGNSDPARARQAFNAALSALAPGAPAQANAPTTTTWEALDAGWPALDALNPMDKQRLVGAMVTAITADGAVTLDEAELLRTASALIHVPVPALIG